MIERHPASVRPEPGSVETMAPLVTELRALADCDSRAGEPLGKCMRKAADKIERLAEHVDYIEAQWLAKADALSAKDRELAEARAALEECAEALDSLGNASDAHVSPVVWRQHDCEEVLRRARTVLSREKEAGA